VFCFAQARSEEFLIIGSQVGNRAKINAFDPVAFLATIGEGRRITPVAKKDGIFSQGDPADSVFYIQEGKVRLSVVSKIGKEATIAMLNKGNFFGEGSLAGQSLRMGSAEAITDCQLLRIEKKAMMEALHREHALSDMFVNAGLNDTPYFTVSAFTSSGHCYNPKPHRYHSAPTEEK
jgi:CRP-like cAMP-binding protein